MIVKQILTTYLSHSRVCFLESTSISVNYKESWPWPSVGLKAIPLGRETDTLTTWLLLPLENLTSVWSMVNRQEWLYTGGKGWSLLVSRGKRVIYICHSHLAPLSYFYVCLRNIFNTKILKGKVSFKTEFCCKVIISKIKFTVQL